MNSNTAQIVKVFVYGTLQPGECNYSRYCRDHVVQHVEAIAYGTLFDLPMGYPAMTAGNQPIYGSVLYMDNPSILPILDDLDDYDPERPSYKNEYIRQEIEVFDYQGLSQGYVWAYVMDLDKALDLGGTILPQGLWQSTLQDQKSELNVQ